MIANYKSKLLGLAAAILGLGACQAAAEAEPASLRPVDVVLEELGDFSDRLEEQGFSGLFAVQKDGELLGFYAVGAARADEGLPYSKDTPFGIGSISKPMTGLLASRLIAKGVLREDMTISDVFGDVPEDKRRITLAQLLTHGAGFKPALGHDNDWIGRDELVALAMESGLLFEPGTGYQYSNTGFSLVAAMIEKVTGEPFDAVLQKELMQPMELFSTGYESVYDPDQIDETPDGRSFYQSAWGKNSPPSWHLTGNGGMTSTVTDLLRLGHLMDTDGLPDGVAELALRPLNPEGPNAETDYGYGIVVIEDAPFGRAYWHNGGNPDFQSDFWVFDDHGITIVGHRNGGEPSLDDVMLEVVRILFGDDVFPEQNMAFEGGKLPEGPAGQMARAFIEAITGDDPAAREAFLTAHMIMPGDKADRVAFYAEALENLHRDFAGAELVGVRTIEEEMLLSIKGAEGSAVITLVADVTDGQARVGGLAIDR